MSHGARRTRANPLDLGHDADLPSGPQIIHLVTGSGLHREDQPRKGRCPAGTTRRLDAPATGSNISMEARHVRPNRVQNLWLLLLLLLLLLLPPRVRRVLGCVSRPAGRRRKHVVHWRPGGGIAGGKTGSDVGCPGAVQIGRRALAVGPFP